MSAESSTDLRRHETAPLYSREHFDGADRLDRIFIWMVSGRDVGVHKLKKSEKDYFKWCEKAYALLFEHRSTREVCKIMRDQVPTRRDISIKGIVNDAQNLFGRFEEIDKRVQRAVVREILIQRLNKMEKTIKDYKDTGETEGRDLAALEKVLMGYLKELRELDQLHKEQGKTIDTSIPEIHITSDPKVLEIEAKIVD